LVLIAPGGAYGDPAASWSNRAGPRAFRRGSVTGRGELYEPRRYWQRERGVGSEEAGLSVEFVYS